MEECGVCLESHCVDRTVVNFVKALRNAEVRVSPAETLDAMEVMRLVGMRDREILKHSLCLALAKTPEEKARFDVCFERFFTFAPFEGQRTKKRYFQGDPETLMGMAGGPSGMGLPRDVSMGAEGDAPLSDLSRLLLARDFLQLSLRVAQAAQRVGLDSMRTLRDRSTFVLEILRAVGVHEIDADIDRFSSQEGAAALVTALRQARAYLTRQVREYVETQYLLHVDATGKRAIVEAALEAHLTHVQPAYFEDIGKVVERIAQRLLAQHKRRRKRARRGLLDTRHTLRRNLAYEGVPFDLRWRKIKVQKPKVFALCDVSGSVARVARFLLLFLYNLTELLPDIRAFAFSNELGEVTSTFERLPVEEAIEEALFTWGKGTTDYARSFHQFRSECIHEIDNRSTVIILGDGRNNYFDPRPEILRDISKRAKQVLWLTPEPREEWDTGDAEMRKFVPYCFRTDVCSTLRDLERFADRLLLSTR